MHSAFLILLAYGLGSIPSAVWVSRLFALPDPRTIGSGNPGATNVLRTGSKGAALLTLLLDAGKGWLAVFLAGWGTDRDPQITQAMAGLAAVIGHLWPIFLGLRGGKGVAPGVGVLLGWSPWLAAAVVAIWLMVAALSRYSSLAAICAALSAPLWGLLFPLPGVMRGSLLALALLILWRHRGNMVRLWRGSETKVSDSRP